MKLKNKTIIITGASDGIGEQIALRLSKKKLQLILIARNDDRLEKIANECKKSGSQVETYTCDLKDVGAINQTVKKIGKKFKQIDGLLNVAGVWQKLAGLADISDQAIIDVLHTNLQGLILLTKKVLPMMNDSKEAVIVNVSSRSGYSAQAGQAVYTASKYGVRGFTEVLREDLKESHIRVAGVYQGGTNTKMFKKSWGDNP